MDISVTKKELFQRLSIQSNAGTAVNLLSDVCPPDELWQPLFAAVENTSSESVVVQWCIRRSSDTRFMAAKATVVTLDALSTNILPLVAPGEQFGAVITGAAQKSPIWLTLTGWVFHERQEPRLPLNGAQFNIPAA